MKHAYIIPVALAGLASTASAQTLTNYWDFSSTNDSVGGVTAIAVGTPDMSVHATYGEAYTGSGASLNTVLGLQDYLIADTHDGAMPLALDFGTGDFSFSYWTYDDNSDLNTKGPRIFDMLATTTTGVQLGTNATNIYNLRIDTDTGTSAISNNTLTTLSLTPNAWVHVAVNVDRANNQYEIFFDGVSQGTVPLVSAGAIFATKDMDIGTINSEGAQSQTETAGLDDLAFYTGLLSTIGHHGPRCRHHHSAGFPGLVRQRLLQRRRRRPDGLLRLPLRNNAVPGTIGGCMNSAGTSTKLIASGDTSVSLPSGSTTDLQFEAEGSLRRARRTCCSPAVRSLRPAWRTPASV